jgi:hypothetical protein
MSSISSTAPASKPGRQNRRPRPRRLLSVSKVYDGCFAVRITVGTETAHYYVEPAPCDYGRAAFNLIKFPNEVKDGEPGSYEVLLHDVRTDSVCPCKGYEKWGWHLDADGNLVSCKHLDSLFKLVDDGRLTLPSKPASKPVPQQPVCTICHSNPVRTDDGMDTCEDCLPRQRPAAKPTFPANFEADFA